MKTRNSLALVTDAAGESLRSKQIRARQILKFLRDDIPDARCALDHSNNYELLVATILSAQCLDSRVNLVTPALLKAAPTPQKMIKLGKAKIQSLIKSINFFKTKASNIYEASKLILSDFNGEVPVELDSLIQLPGVGRKTANVIRAVGFNEAQVVVDTHVRRISNRLGFTQSLDPDDIELDLEKIFPREEWIDASHLIILHGRKTCFAKKPDCERCVIHRYCPSKFLEADAWKA